MTVEHRALSIREPWASLIVDGHKPIENRTWRTNYRGPIFIHAATKWRREDVLYVQNEMGIEVLPGMFRLGGIIGVADLVDVITKSKSPWFSGPIGFVLQNPRRVPFVPLRGRLSLFRF